MRDVTIGDGSDRNKPDAMPSRLTAKAALEYQACDDRFRYLRSSVPLHWNVKITRWTVPARGLLRSKAGTDGGSRINA